MRKKKFYKVFIIKIVPFLFIGFSIGVIAIWPGLVSGNNRRCFFNILKDGSDGDIQLKTMLKVKPNYLLKIKNARNNYLKVLLIGDSCFRNFWKSKFWLRGKEFVFFKLLSKLLLDIFKSEFILKYNLIKYFIGKTGSKPVVFLARI